MRREINHFLKSYFKFNHQEKTMVWVLTVLIVILIGLNIFFNSSFFYKPTTTEFDYALSDSINKLITKNKNAKNMYLKDTVFVFNPNKASKDELILLGFKEKLAERLIKYREKVVFKKADDLKKLYGVNIQLIEKLAPYMVFDKIKQYAKKDIPTEINYSEKFTEKKQNKIININTANQEELMDLKGIGPTLSKRIITYREKLGGFREIEQLLEVYGIDSSVISNNTQFILVNSNDITQLKINKVEWKELVSHPYIDGKTASFIINYRQQHGPYKSIDDLRKIKVIKEDFIVKISDYLNFAEE